MVDILIPGRPDWCLEEDEDNMDDDGGINGKFKGGRGRRKLPEFQNEVSQLVRSFVSFY